MKTNSSEMTITDGSLGTVFPHLQQQEVESLSAEGRFVGEGRLMMPLVHKSTLKTRPSRPTFLWIQFPSIGIEQKRLARFLRRYTAHATITEHLQVPVFPFISDANGRLTGSSFSFLNVPMGCSNRIRGR